jgi:hypothetical protein
MRNAVTWTNMTRCTAMYRRLPLVFVVILASCAGQPSANAPSSSASPTAPLANPASTASQSAVPSSVPTCRLPVSRPQVQPGNPYLTTGLAGGFLQLPSGQYSDDASSLASLDPAAPSGRLPSVFMTTKSPILRGSNNELSGWGAELSYDSAFGRWLPVPSPWVSPDGVRYAYADAVVVTNPLPTSRVHIVDVATGADHVVIFPGSDLARVTQWLAGVVAFTGQGVYLSLSGSNQGAGPDTGKLWLLDPETGTVRKVSDLSGTWLVSGGAAWTLLPTSTAGPATPNRLVRLDLSNGQLAEWWVDAGYEPVSSPGAVTQLSVIGLDGAGSPIVVGDGEVGNGATYRRVVDVWAIKTPNHAVALDVSSADVGNRAIQPTWEGATTDRAGTWIALNNRLFLYRTDGTFSKVADGAYSPSGACT